MRRGIGSDDYEEEDGVEIECKIIHRTEQGVKIKTASVAVWLPRKFTTEGEGVVTIPEWLAMSKGLV